MKLLIFLSFIIFGLGQSRPQQRDDLQKVQVVLQQQERQPRAQQSAVSQIVTKILQPPTPSVVARKFSGTIDFSMSKISFF